MVRLYKTKYRDKETKQEKISKNWTIDFVDHLRHRRRWPLGIPNKRACEAIGDKINHLVTLKMAKLPPDRETSEWLESIPGKLRDKLARIGLISSERAAGGKALSDHIDDFEKSLIAKDITPKHAKQTSNRIRKLVAGCGFRSWSDITISKVETYLKSRREAKEAKDKISKATSDYYLKFTKQFLTWMMKNNRATTNPLEHAQYVDDGTDKQHEHCPLTVEEFRQLWENTIKSDEIVNGATGIDRAILYLTAAETGLRANELRNLVVSDFDFNDTSPTVTVLARTAKNRKDALLPIRKDTALVLREYLSGKLLTARAFMVPEKTAKMLKADLEAANIPYKAEDGSYRDFHGLRHTTATLLAAGGVHPSVAQQILRHSDIRLTMQIYTHTYHEQHSDAIESLPDLTAPSKKQKGRAVMTGTSGSELTDRPPNQKITAKTLAKPCTQPRITMDDGELQDPSSGSETAILLRHQGLEPRTHGLRVQN